VIACNTASVQVLPALRERYALPFVGTVPAIKPACAASHVERVSVLGTEATVAREYTHALIRRFRQGLRRDPGRLGAACGARRSGLARRAVDDADIAPRSRLLRQDGSDAPTRSCLPARTIRCCSTASSGLAPWPVRWLDPAPAIARRVVELVGPADGQTADRVRRSARLHLGRAPSRRLAAALAEFGLSRRSVAARFDTSPGFRLETARRRGYEPARRFAPASCRRFAHGLSVPGSRDRGGRGSSTDNQQRTR
jgi:glutamate racemase